VRHKLTRTFGSSLFGRRPPGGLRAISVNGNGKVVPSAQRNGTETLKMFLFQPKRNAKSAVKRFRYFYTYFWPVITGIRSLCKTAVYAAVNQNLVNKDGDHMRYSVSVKSTEGVIR